MRSECEAVFLFIAELTGSFVAGSGNKEDKIVCGEKDYIENNLHALDLTTEEGKKDIHENMWLERLYNELDAYFSIAEGCSLSRRLSIEVGTYRDAGYKWSVPIELDASASVLQYLGILLGDVRLMRMTNVVGDTLEDPWKLKGMSRLMLKTAATPMLYASSQTCSDLWKKAKLKFKPKDVTLYNEEMSAGPFGLANMFKEFLVNNCHPKAQMEITIGEADFGISCNRFRNVGEKTKAYKIWDSIDKQYNTLLHTDTKKVPDLEQFRRFFPTLLIHHLDSTVMDNVMKKVIEKYQFAIPIHDAAVVSPAAAVDVRKWYAEELDDIYANRESILKGFFKSIGINASASEQWEKLKAKIVPFEGDFKCSGMALK